MQVRPHDVQNFNGAHGFSGSHHGYNRGLSFEAVSALLRLGTKYEIEYLRRDAVDRLQIVFPQCLKGFQNTFAEHSADETDPAYPFHTKAIEKMPAHNVIAAINLARTFQLSAILPPAFYIAAQLSPADLISGCKDADGHEWKLSQEDLTRVFAGQGELREYWFEQFSLIWEARPAPTCTSNTSSCRDTLASLRSRHISDLHTYTAILVAHIMVPRRGLCTPCRDSLVIACNTARSGGWRRLTEFFKLQTTDEAPGADVAAQ